MRSLYLTLIYFAFFVLGAQAPFIITLGYVWVDIFRPNAVSFSLLNQIPASMIMAAGAIGSYFLLDRKSPPRFNWVIILVLLFAGWVTLTTIWSYVPSEAWLKWDWAFKTLVFTAFVPFVFRSRVQIEALLCVYTFSFMAHIIAFGLKTFVSGGGYGQSLGLLEGNSGIAESSTLAGVSASMIPLLIFLKDYGRIIPRNRWTGLMYWGLIGISVSANVGTYARTGLIGLGIAAVGIWLRSRHKALLSMVGVVAVLVGFQYMPESWRERMSTTTEYSQEHSALGRVLVWQWTWDFVKDHPLGGGFAAYLLNTIVMPGDEDGASDQTEVTGKAFHSIYFEVLGEHGYIGILIFLALAFTSIGYNLGSMSAREPIQELHWARGLAMQLTMSLLILMVCGLFVGIAFQPPLYYLFAASACLHEYVRRVRANMKPAPGVYVPTPPAASAAVKI